MKRRDKIYKILSKYTENSDGTHISHLNLDKRKSMGSLTIYGKGDQNIDKWVDNFENDTDISGNVFNITNPNRVVDYDGTKAEYCLEYHPERLDKKYNELFPSYSPASFRSFNYSGSSRNSDSACKKMMCQLLTILFIVIIVFFAFYFVITRMLF